MLRSIGRRVCACFLLVAAASPALSQVVFVDNFGTSVARIKSPYVPQSGADPAYFLYAPGPPIADGYYAVLPTHNLSTVTSSTYWGAFDDHTAGHLGRGAALVVNAGDVTNQFYRRTFAGVAGANYKVTAYRYTRRSNADIGNFSRIRFEAQDIPTEAVLNRSGPLQTGIQDTWEEISWTFTVPLVCTNPVPIAIALRNDYAHVNGNDFAIDDITLTQVNDPGDTLNCPPTPSNHPFTTTVDDSSLVLINQSKTLPLTANDSVSNGGELDFASLTVVQPSHGSVAVSLVDGSVVYTPNANYAGADSFTYTVCDKTIPTPSCSTSKVTLHIVPQNNSVAIPTLGTCALSLLSLSLAALGWRSRRAIRP